MTRRVSLAFRGSLRQLYQTFQFGSSDELPETQTPSRMYCSGPSGVRMVPGSADNEHWDCNVDWVGLHSYTSTNGASSAIWRLSPNWSVREFKLPYTTARDSTPNTIYPASYMVPASITNNDVPCTVYDSVPSINVRGIVVSAIFPHPKMPELTTLRALFPIVIPASQINENAIDLSAEDKADVGYNYCKEMGASTPSGTGMTPSVGAWRIGDISAERVIEPVNLSGGGFQVGATRIYVITFPAIWTPRRTTI